MVISGLASLLGLGGIADKIKKILETIQKPVGKVVDGIINGVIKYGKKLLGKLKQKKKDAAGAAEGSTVKAEATKQLDARIHGAADNSTTLQGHVAAVLNALRPQGLKQLSAQPLERQSRAIRDRGRGQSAQQDLHGQGARRP